MSRDENREYLLFECDNGHNWGGTFFPNTPPEVGTLVGLWNCPYCNEPGIVVSVENPDTKSKEISYLVPIDRKAIENAHLPVKGLLDSARQLVSNTLRHHYGEDSIKRIKEIDNNLLVSNDTRKDITGLWQLQDILDIIEEMLED